VLLEILRGEYQIQRTEQPAHAGRAADRTGGQNRRNPQAVATTTGSSENRQDLQILLTELGQRAVLVGLKLKEHLIVPGLPPPAPERLALKDVAPLASIFSVKD